VSDDARCTGCGAKIPTADGACPYCGTASGAVAAPPVAADPAALRAERFRRVRESRSYENERANVPTSSGAAGKHWNRVLTGAVFAAISLFIFTRSGRHGGAFVLVPTAFVLIGVGIVVASAARITRFRRAPTRTSAAIVAAKRTEVRRGKHGGTDYHVTLEFESGARHEYEVTGSMYGTVTEDDIGVAHIRDAYLTGFRRIEV
jgi:hypothetical protein